MLWWAFSHANNNCLASHMVRMERVLSLSQSLSLILFFPQAAVQRFNHVILKAQHWKPLTVPRGQSRETKAKARAKASCQEPPSPAATQKNKSKTPVIITPLPRAALWLGDENLLPSPSLHASPTLLSSQLLGVKHRGSGNKVLFSLSLEG